MFDLKLILPTIADMTNLRLVSLLGVLAVSGAGACKKKTETTQALPPAASPSPTAAVAKAPASAPAGAGLILERVHFALDRWDLAPEATRSLAKDAKQLLANPGLRIRVEGHADERGGTIYNLALSEKRAASGRAYLVDLGVAPNRIETIAYGEERPRAKGHDEQAWSENRRGELEVTGSGSTSAR